MLKAGLKVEFVSVHALWDKERYDAKGMSKNPMNFIRNGDIGVVTESEIAGGGFGFGVEFDNGDTTQVFCGEKNFCGKGSDDLEDAVKVLY